MPQVSSRIADVVEQIDELRKELADLSEKHKAMREYVIQHLKEHKNGGAQ